MFASSLKLSATQRIVLSFLIIILTGSILLSLPISQRPGATISYWDNLFSATSMVCVAGLSIKPISECYSQVGQTIAMVLIQIGGLSLMSFIGLFALRGGRKLSFINMSTLQEALSISDTLDFKKFITTIFRYTFWTELLGAFILSFRFVPQFGLKAGLFNALFTAVSAFCNAGFDNIGSSSLQAYQTDWLVNGTVALLIILGGLGFAVWFDLRNQFQLYRTRPKLRFHTKVVLGLTAIILVCGTLTTLISEYHNPATIGNLPFPEKVLSSFFQTVTMRTAGFATIDYTKANPATLLLYIFQMMLGGAPGGTAGGIKITAFLTLLLYARSEIRGLPYTNFRHRTIDNTTIRKAFAVSSIFLGCFLIGLFGLTLTDSKTPFIHLVFETMSALATVGVSANLTPSLSVGGQVVLLFLMFFGRVGPMSFLLSLSRQKKSAKETTHYSKSTMIV